MKKQEAIKLIQSEKYCIELDRKEEKDIELLREILREVCPIDKSNVFGIYKYYYKKEYGLWGFSNELPNNLTPIKITDITDIENDEFVNGDEVDVSDDEIKWYENEYYIGKNINGEFVTCGSDGQPFTWQFIRKSNNERFKAIDTIKDLMAKFEIKKEEL